jgi:hypothetical protein
MAWRNIQFENSENSGMKFDVREVGKTKTESQPEKLSVIDSKLEPIAQIERSAGLRPAAAFNDQSTQKFSAISS